MKYRYSNAISYKKWEEMNKEAKQGLPMTLCQIFVGKLGERLGLMDRVDIEEVDYGEGDNKVHCFKLSVDDDVVEEVVRGCKANAKWDCTLIEEYPFECSYCGVWQTQRSAYCPSCGAKMKEEEND